MFATNHSGFVRSARPRQSDAAEKLADMLARPQNQVVGFCDDGKFLFFGHRSGSIEFYHKHITAKGCQVHEKTGLRQPQSGP